MRICSIDGCGKKHNAKDLCVKHYQEEYYKKNSTKTRREIIDCNNIDWSKSCRVFHCGYMTRVKVYKKVKYLILEHHYIWEKHNGKIPEGMIIHHINENKVDNRIENLQLLTRKEHIRLHAGWKLIGEQWWKPCKKCGNLLENNHDNFHIHSKNLYMPICRNCLKEIGKERYKKIKEMKNHKGKNYE